MNRFWQSLVGRDYLECVVERDQMDLWFAWRRCRLTGEVQRIVVQDSLLGKLWRVTLRRSGRRVVATGTEVVLSRV